MRVVAFTYETPTGQLAFYEKKEIFGLDLERTRFRAVESFDNDGEIFESVVFEHIEQKPSTTSPSIPKTPITLLIRAAGTRARNRRHTA